MVDAAVSALTDQVRRVVAASPGSTIKARQRKAYRTLGIPLVRVMAFWNERVRRVEVGEADQLRERIARFWQGETARQAEIAGMDRRLSALRAELAQIESLDGIRPAAARRLARRPQRQRLRPRTA